MAKEYHSIKVPELKALTKSRGLFIPGLSKKKKAELILELQEDDASREPPPKKGRVAKPQVKKDVYRTEITMDFGTSKWCVSYDILCNDKRTESAAKSLFIYEQGSIEVPMVAAWIDGELVQGHTLLDRAKKDRQLSKKIMHYFKLLLYPDTKTDEVTMDIERILREEGKSHVDLLTEHIQAAFKDARAAFIRKEERRDKFSEAMLGDMFDRALVRFTVPEMWKPDARRTMQIAAKRAGLATVVLASEALCALSWWVDEEARKKHAPNKQWGEGDSVLLADLGAGTADFTLAEFLEPLTVNSKVKAIGHSSGALAGSVTVDLLLLEMFRIRKGTEWLSRACKELGDITADDFQSRLLIVIEIIRIKFDPKVDDDEFEYIRAGNGGDIKVDINKAEYEKAMNVVLQEIKDYLWKFVQLKKPSIIVVVGGFSKSPYVLDDLIACFKPEGIDVVCPNEGLFGLNSPVARGASIRYDYIAKQHLPSPFGFALLVTLPYHKEEFPDEDPEEFPSFYDPEVIVLHDRMQIFIQKGYILKDGVPLKLPVPRTYYISQDTPFISVDCVYLTEEFDNNAAAKLLHETEFRPGVKKWFSAEIPIDRRLLEGKGYPEITGLNKERFWVVDARAMLTCRNEDMRFGFDILKPQESIGEEDGDVAFHLEEELWNAKYSEFLES